MTTTDSEPVSATEEFWRQRWERAVQRETATAREAARLRTALNDLNEDVEQLLNDGAQQGAEAAKSHAVRRYRSALLLRRQEGRELRAKVEAVLGLHRLIAIDTVAWECAQHDCAHGITCPKTRPATCAECYRIAVDDENDPDRVETTVPPEWPCPTAKAAGVTA